MLTLEEEMKKLPVSRRNKVEKRAKKLIAEEISLRNLRKARNRPKCVTGLQENGLFIKT